MRHGGHVENAVHMFLFFDMQKIPNSLSMSPQKNWQLVVDSYTPEIFTWNLENDVTKMI
jgi:sugar lactone lactonase YvrE